MTVERMVELLEIEKECVLRNASGECNRYCAGCDLLQDDTELHEMYTEAIALLKAQEPIAPVKVNRYMETDENGDWFSPETYDCGNCGVELHGKANYCHLCGRAVKWE